MNFRPQMVDQFLNRCIDELSNQHQPGRQQHQRPPHRPRLEIKEQQQRARNGQAVRANAALAFPCGA